MKINGRNIKRRLYGLKTLPTRLARARYFRGHGVHSPFVYAIVRQVFMKHRLRSEETALHDRLVVLGIPQRRAVQLQNLSTWCHYTVWSVDRLPDPCDLCILTTEVGEKETCEIVRRAARQGTTLAVMAPYDGRDRAMLCRQLIAGHGCTTIDNRAYLLIFNNHLPKQHFRL